MQQKPPYGVIIVCWVKRFILWIIWAGVGLYILPPSHAQLTTPFQIGTLQPVEDEFGSLLEGIPEAPGDLVQIIRTTENGIQPPDTEGQPGVGDEVIAETRVGHLAPPTGSKTGHFGLSLTGPDRPEHGDKVFVRVFNAPSKEDASFYGDSTLFTVNKNKEFPVSILGAKTPLDSADDDNDGLHNSYEKSLGMNKGNPDSDGDGFIDGHEFAAGTDGLDGSSFLAISRMTPQGDDLYIEWESVVDIRYQLQYSNDPLSQPPVYIPKSPVITATDGTTGTLVPAGLPDPSGHYRVKVVTP